MDSIGIDKSGRFLSASNAIKLNTFRLETLRQWQQLRQIIETVRRKNARELLPNKSSVNNKMKHEILLYKCFIDNSCIAVVSVVTALIPE